MNRYVIALVVVVLGIGAVVFVSGASEPDAPTAAGGDETADGRSAFVPVRPGQIEDPGQPRFGLGGWSTNFEISSVPFSEISSGGPGKDGIPAVDDPKFESIEGRGNGSAARVRSSPSRSMATPAPIRWLS